MVMPNTKKRKLKGPPELKNQSSILSFLTPSQSSKCAKLEPKELIEVIDDEEENASVNSNTRKKLDSVKKDTTGDEPPVHKTKFTKLKNNENPIEVNNNAAAENVNNEIVEDELDDEDVKKVPYYLENFKYVLKTVFEDDDNRILFDDDELQIIDTFQNLSVQAQKLYIRLFQRKQNWHRLTVLHQKYEELSNNFKSVVTELLNTSFLIDEKELTDINIALELLKSDEIKTLIREFNIGGKSKNKKESIDCILKHGKQQKTVFSSSNNTQEVILKRCKKILGKCVHIYKDTRKIFLRVLFLFSLVNCNEDDDEVKWNQNPLLMMLLVKMGRTSYPTYKIIKETAIFKDRDELIRYTDALQIECDILNAIENKQWQHGQDLLKQVFQTISLNDDDQSFPKDKSFLNRFTVQYVYQRCVSHGVDILQRIKDYKSAVEKLQWLIQKENSSFHSRGRWFERLALNHDQHLKDQQKAISAIKQGLAQPDLRPHHKLSLSIRGFRIKNSAKGKKLSNLFDDIELHETPEFPSVTIKKPILKKFTESINTKFIRRNERSEGGADDFVVCSVEEVAMDHYLDNGYSDGLHGEGSTFITIYCLLFWDIIYNHKISDIFRVNYQAYPLDLNSDCFYEARKSKIDLHLKWIKGASTQRIIKMIKHNWENHYELVSLAKWDRFADMDHLISLVKCLNGRMLHCICSRFAKDYRTYRSGFPDLVVWNEKANKMKIVEVKGPGDKLSTKQMIWLDIMNKADIPCEVCYVQGVNTKKLQN